MNTLQNIMAKSTVTALIALCLGFTLSAQAELSLVVDGVFSSPDTAIRQGDSATFSVTVSVEGDLPAGEHIADDYFELYWSINRQSDFYCVYSLGPTTATSISYTFDEGESYTIMCSVAYYYKIEDEDDYTELWTEAEGFKDVVKVTGISLRASGAAKTIGDTWVKDDWDITTVPSGHRDMVDLPDHTIATHVNTVTATCGTSHADFVYRGILTNQSWTWGTGGDTGPDDMDYTVSIEGDDGDFQVDYMSVYGEGGIESGTTQGDLTDGVPYTDTVNVAMTDDLWTGGGGGYASLGKDAAAGCQLAHLGTPMPSDCLRSNSDSTPIRRLHATEGELDFEQQVEAALKNKAQDGIVTIIGHTTRDIISGKEDYGQPNPNVTVGNHGDTTSIAKQIGIQAIRFKDATPIPPGTEFLNVASLTLSVQGYSLKKAGGLYKYAVKPSGTLVLQWSTDHWQVNFDRYGYPDTKPGMAAITLSYYGSSPVSVRNPTGSGYYSVASSGYTMSTGYSLYVDSSGTKTKDKYHVKFEGIPEVVGPPGDPGLFSLDYVDPEQGVSGSTTTGSTVTVQF